MLLLWLLQSGAIIVLARRKPATLAVLGRVLSMVAGLALILMTLGWVVVCCAPDTGLMHVQTLHDAVTGARLEVYHTDQHDHVGVELFWGNDAFPFASGHYYQDHFDVNSVALDSVGRVVVRSYLTADSLVLQLSTGDIKSSKQVGSPE